MVTNARGIGLVLSEFQSEYGKFPEKSLVPLIKGRTGSVLSLEGETSNDVFAQLFAAGIDGSENIFRARGISTNYPDEVWNSDSTVLSNGECSFAYIPGADLTGSPGTPIALGPAVPGTTTFDMSACGGMAVVLTLDNQVISLPIDAKGNIIYHGKSILDPRQPFWKGKAPDVRWPK